MNEYMEKIKEKILNLGFMVIEQDNPEYFYFSDGKHIGCASYDNIEGLVFSSKYVPTKNHGDGARFASLCAMEQITKEFLESVMTHSFSNEVKWYKDLKEFLSKELSFWQNFDNPKEFRVILPDGNTINAQEYIELY